MSEMLLVGARLIVTYLVDVQSRVRLFDLTGAPRGEVALISINGEMFEGEDVLVKDTDTILLFPPVGGG